MVRGTDLFYEDLPSDTFELTLINKSYFFCCYKQSLNCGDSPNPPSHYFLSKIIKN
jgi:hypothetical protein